MFEKATEYPALPPDDLKRNLTIARSAEDERLPHIGLVSSLPVLRALLALPSFRNSSARDSKGVIPW
jgi:hypothetical protein